MRAKPRRKSRPKIKKLFLPNRCLIIECDVDRLGEQNLNFGQELDKIINSFKFESKIIAIKSAQEAPTQFSNVFNETKQFDIVVLVGHGSPEGMRFSSDSFINYSNISKWISQFRPKILFMVTCKGGHSIATEALFQGIKSVKEIYGSPVNSSKAALGIVKLIIPLLFLFGKLNKEILLTVKWINFLVTDGVLLTHTRSDFLKNKPIKSLLDDLFPLVVQLKRALFK